MKVLVAGADGFIGRSVSAALAAAGDEVFYGSRSMPAGADESHYRHTDLLDPENLRQVITEVKPDVIVNCAGVVDMSQDVDGNRVFTQNLIEAVKASGQKARRIIICGSAGVYGQIDPSELPIKESTPLRGTSPYAQSKLREEETALELGAKYGMPVTIARIFNPIGSNMAPRYLISNILNQVGQLERGERTELEVSRLDSPRDYVDVKDVAQAIKAIVHGEPKEPVYNVGSGKPTTNALLIELILSNYGVESVPPIKETSEMPEAPVASQADITRIQEDLGWKPTTTIEDSIKGVVDEANRKH